jgi:hypothetical protein
MAKVFGHDADWRLPPGHRYAHLHLGHLEVIAKNYVDHARKRDTFRPLILHREELNLERVVAGYWKMTDEGLVVLGESKFIMEFPLQLPDGKTVIYHHAGKPDLPISMAGSIRILDHKTTSSRLSDWWAAKHRFSNQLRGYAAMVNELTPYVADGALINAVYVGKEASDSLSKATKFARFGPFLYQPAHLTEALLNQYYWKQWLFKCHEQQYYPQNPDQHCGSCEMSELCNANPASRESAMRMNYKQSDRNIMETFLSL